MSAVTRACVRGCISQRFPVSFVIVSLCVDGLAHSQSLSLSLSLSRRVPSSPSKAKVLTFCLLRLSNSLLGDTTNLPPLCLFGIATTSLNFPRQPYAHLLLETLRNRCSRRPFFGVACSPSQPVMSSKFGGMPMMRFWVLLRLLGRNPCR